VNKAEFEAYDRIRESGVTNMWAVDLVCRLSGLVEEKVLFIMKNYSKLKEEYK